MRASVVVCVCIMLGLTLGDTVTHHRGCIYIHGKCHRECEEGTHAYAVGCGVVTKEATCDDPHPMENKDGGIICDYSACYCDPPTVRDKDTKKCVRLEDCPKKKDH